MVGAGVSVLDALRLSAEVSGNYYYQQVWENVLDQVTGGNQIYVALAPSSLFPSMLVQIIRSGEETGKLDVVLEKVSAHYDVEVEQALKTATSMIEPIMITVMGVVVGGIAMSLLLPIFSLGRTVH
jgi:type IV pilus assembly protein PilC